MKGKVVVVTGGAKGIGEAIVRVLAAEDAIPVIVDRVTTLCGPGELIDVIVTERGIAVNPRRRDLLDAVAGSKLPIRPIEDLKADIEQAFGHLN